MAGRTITIDRRQLIVEMQAVDPLLKREAEQAIKLGFFLPAVEEMKREFLSHPVTQEIAGGAGAPNVSGTLEAPFREDGANSTPANLWGFIGFDAAELGLEGALKPILDRLDPSNPDGPKVVFQDRDKSNLTYSYLIKAPNEEAIYNDTPLPWLSKGGPSWVQRIEQGIPGVGQFLNKSLGDPPSRSSGGIQVQATLRSGRYRPTSYLSRILNNFLRRASGRGATQTRRGFKD